MKTKYFTIAFLLACTGLDYGYVVDAAAADEKANAEPKPLPLLPLALEITVPWEPTAFPSNGKVHLFYEIYLRNFESSALDLRGIEVFDATKDTDPPLAIITAEQLPSLLKIVGAANAGNSGEDPLRLGTGASAIVYMQLAFDNAAAVPARLRHHIRTTEAAIAGSEIGTHHEQLPVLGPPLQGVWYAETGPANDHGHRRGYFVVNGHPHITRRYAFDWMRRKNGAFFAGDPTDNAAYFAYGEKVLAVADAKVVVVNTGVPSNVPGHAPTVPMTLATVTGNSVTLDLGEGHYARYMHMQPDSIKVKVGDVVRRGQVLGLVGNSGDSRSPHLHFELTTSASLIEGEGVPYVIDEYRLLDARSKSFSVRTQELPLNHMRVDFGQRESL